MNENQEMNGKRVDSEITNSNNTNNSEYIEPEINNAENDTTCGIGNWRPNCLQPLATPKLFLINFSLVAIFQGASFTYLIGSLSTLEKRYGFESKVSGFILIADNLSQMVLNPFIGYLGSKYNKPAIMAVGELIVALSCFMCVTPYFIFGSVNYAHTISYDNHTYYEHEVCDANRNNDCTESPTVWTAVIILWVASFINGMGFTAFYTVGLPYMDDSTSKKNSPIYLSFSASIRLFGPAFGFLLSSFCLNLYENPFLNPDFARNDPRWIGAWWVGYLIIGTALTLCSIPLMLFPTIMKNTNSPKQSSDANKDGDTKKWAFESFKRLVKNPIFMFNLFGMNLRLLGYLGYYINKPKYVEAQFRKSASVANFWTGLTSIPTMAIGILAGGLCLSKIKPKARNLVTYMFIVELITNLAILGAMFLRCPLPLFPQALLKNGNLDLTSVCNENCQCTKKLFQPVCADDGVSNYFSPCFAGCSSFNYTSTEKIFSGCSCIDEYAKVSNGYCGTDCNMFPLFVSLLGVAGVIMSTAKIGDTLLTLRCVEPRDKSFAMGIIGSFLAIFAFIPYPLIYGTITDMSCIVWKESCGKTGNCWLYDIEKFGYYLHLTSFTFLMVGTLFDLPIIYYANRIKNMFDDDNDDTEPNSEFEMGKTNVAFNGSIDRSIDMQQLDKPEIEEKQRKTSLTDYELVHRKNSFVSI